MPTKITNTNTNINRININVPRRNNPRPTKKNVAKAEQELSQVENLDREIPYISQAPSQFINPSVFGFNSTPIQQPVRPQTVSRGTQTEPMETQTEQELFSPIQSPETVYAEPVFRSKDFVGQRGTTPRDPIPFRSSSTPEQRDVLSLGYSEPQYKINIPSDFPDRLARQQGFQPSAFQMPIISNRMRDIQKQGRPDLDINQMARNVKEAYRAEPIVPFAKEAQPFEEQPLEVALPPASKPTRGRPVGSKSKPKDPDAPKKPRKVKQIIEVGEEGAFATAGGGLRGQREELL
jgi:hypothetical protein